MVIMTMVEHHSRLFLEKPFGLRANEGAAGQVVAPLHILTAERAGRRGQDAREAV